MDIALDVPDYTRLCRRAKTAVLSDLKNIHDNEDIHILIDSTGLKIFGQGQGQGQWHAEKHGLKKRREWRKRHLVIDRDTHAIVAQELTTYYDSDDFQVEPLLENIEKNILSVSADGAYDADRVYQGIAKSSTKGVVVAIPPRQKARLSENNISSPSKRDHNILFVEEYGKYRWQNYSDYGYRALVETAMSRYKTIIGGTMFSRDLSAQKAESKIACLVPNKMAKTRMPKSIRVKNAA